ncbi:hypothetical protein PAPYR_8907 [Paratrimastix pyriformis]|uniref:Uncharacterized protein n=1 Tax=Paratrimastix pyriformis TaxID=342808 RepID=A0ABQ8UEA0_9EUKA|nr:hypothetical protein PAPYR_8907 [Paratrimastix pyriformis]
MEESTAQNQPRIVQPNLYEFYLLLSLKFFSQWVKEVNRLRSHNQECKFYARIVVLGGIAVGRTALVFRFLENRWLPLTMPTVFEYYNKTITFGQVPASQLDLGIWEPNSMSKFHSVVKHLVPFDRADAAIIAFSFDREGSLEATRYWASRLGPGCLRFLVCCKDEARYGRAREIAREIGAEYWETSAKTGSPESSVPGVVPNGTPGTSCLMGTASRGMTGP